MVGPLGHVGESYVTRRVRGSNCGASASGAAATASSYVAAIVAMIGIASLVKIVVQRYIPLVVISLNNRSCSAVGVAQLISINHRKP